MKANELMVGDLLRVNKDVCLKKGTIVEVRGIDADNEFIEKGLKGCATCVNINDHFESGGIWVDFLEPIPLTSEILEKNRAFKNPLMGEQRHFTYNIGGFELLAIYDADFSFQINRGARKIKYVHELQHALKLYGIDKNIII